MTTASTKSRDPVRITAAWDWMLRMQADEISEEDLAAWLAWYESDPANKDAYDEASHVWQNAPQVIKVSDALPERGQPLRAIQKPRIRNRWAWSGALAASLLIATVAVSLYRDSELQPLPILTVDAPGSSTPAADKRALVQEAMLPDGSRVQLAARSNVSMSFTDSERRLVMDEGVAYFTVAHNKQRPFIVNIGKVRVRAVGTAFNIRNAGGRVVVTVAEGSVDVYDGDSSSRGHLTHIAAGTELTWASDQTGPSVAAVDAANALAWRDGRLDYVDEPLASAIADINRYSSHHVVIRDASIGRLRFSGSVRTDSVDEWVRALPELFPIDARYDAEGNVALTTGSWPGT